jgi:hypothetical protein
VGDDDHLSGGQQGPSGWPMGSKSNLSMRGDVRLRKWGISVVSSVGRLTANENDAFFCRPTFQPTKHNISSIGPL